MAQINFEELKKKSIEFCDGDEDAIEAVLEDIEKLKSMTEDDVASLIAKIDDGMEEYIREMCGEDEANDDMIEYANKKCLELFLKEHPDVDFSALDEDEQQEFLSENEDFNAYKSEIPENRESEVYSIYYDFILEAVIEKELLHDNTFQTIKSDAAENLEAGLLHLSIVKYFSWMDMLRWKFIV